MKDTPPEEDQLDEDSSREFDSLAEAVERLDIPLNIQELLTRGFSTADILYALDRCPFVQITDGKLKAQPYDAVELVTSTTGWVIHDYGDAMGSSPGRLLFGGGYRSDDDDEGGGGATLGTIVRQRYMTARHMVSLAIEHGWGSVNVVDGHPAMMRDVWIESQRQGIAVRGFKPSQADVAVRDRIEMSSDALTAKRARSPKSK